ncbi:ER lumen protein-retaining receptor erd-2.2-like [Zingiber officinale]|uniref:ER lumen protein-retaining receptor erd-2.2-like n=1 Tax=Zingiber officinale TaxID=94328 RepID=UPI001C4B1C03|nr:ER lumen protein-retaining receptor erd-2.2-like [Zingiber officinale]
MKQSEASLNLTLLPRFHPSETLLPSSLRALLPLASHSFFFFVSLKSVAVGEKGKEESRAMGAGSKRPINTVVGWVTRQPPKIRACLCVVVSIAALVFLGLVVHNHDNLFVAAEAAHAVGISVLIYKLVKERTCAGLSLKSQYLTALFLAVRLYCSFILENDIHTVLDTATLATTLWVIYMIQYKLKSSYMEDKDNFAIYYVIVPSVLLAVVVHPSTAHFIFNRIFWAFCVYVEAVSVLPQLRLMQNTQIVEPFTAHYVFALGVTRFLSCAHWVLKVVDTRGGLLTAMGHGLWPPMVLIAEIVQTFILADFCYYYVKSVFGGQLVLRLSSGVV